MGEDVSNGGIGRRELLKRGAVAGGIVWASPMVFSAVAGAASVGACTDCPDGRLFGIKYNNGSGLESLPTTGGGGGNCLQGTASAPPECFEDYFTGPTGNSSTHTWVLQPALQLCQVAAKVGQGTTTQPNGCFVCSTGTCSTSEGSITIVTNGSGVTTVTVSYSALSHSEILFCYRGSPNACVGSL